ncbi:TLC domain-containing protein 4-B-like [Branchiostoma lanceolatum]|uniref:TLC domain-containing protein 4-B-like n=1 Tax=Branchiostoma lanceolatum TaxID=7740 RepID=UPI0034545989
MAYTGAHLLTILASFSFHLAVYSWLAAPVLGRLSPVFKTLPPGKQVVLKDCVMSLVHALIPGSIGLYVFLYPGDVLPDKVWFDSHLVRHATCVGLGYTLADTLLKAVCPPLYDRTMTLHHVIALCGGYAVSVDPVLPYFINFWLMMELSGPFLHLRSILLGLGQGQSRLYRVNGVSLWVVFLACRVVTIPVWWAQFSQHVTSDDLSGFRLLTLISVFVLHPAINVLNLYWFGKISWLVFRYLKRS